MRPAVKLRTLTTDEQAEIRRLAASCTASIRLVQRAKIIELMAVNPKLLASDAGVQAGFKSRQMGPQWVRRFNIEDNLVTHSSKQVKQALAAWPEIQLQFIPKYACWLNLIEPWWKKLRSLALKGRRFEGLDEPTHALNAALDYWNAHAHPYYWRKKPHIKVLSSVVLASANPLLSLLLSKRTTNIQTS